jgi:Flp pilus assembly protein TadG
MLFRTPCRRRFPLGTNGAAALELGVVAPMLMLFATMFLDVNKAYRDQTQITAAVGAGAEFAYVAAQTGTASAATIISEITSEVVATSNALLTANNVSIYLNGNPVNASTASTTLTSYWAQRCCLSGSGSTISFSGCSSTPPTCTDASNPGLYLTITASASFSPYISVDTQMTGKTLSGSIITRIQ